MFRNSCISKKVLASPLIASVNFLPSRPKIVHVIMIIIIIMWLYYQSDVYCHIVNKLLFGTNYRLMFLMR